MPYKSRAAKGLKSALKQRNISLDDLDDSKYAEDPEIIKHKVCGEDDGSCVVRMEKLDFRELTVVAGPWSR